MLLGQIQRWWNDRVMVLGRLLQHILLLQLVWLLSGRGMLLLMVKLLLLVMNLMLLIAQVLGRRRWDVAVLVGGLDGILVS